MKKTYLYIIVAVIVLSVIAALIIPQIAKKEVGTPTPFVTEGQNLEAEGPLKSEGQDLNKIIIDDANFGEMDAEIGVL